MHLRRAVSSFNDSGPNWFFLGLTKYPALKNNLSTSEEQAGIGKRSDSICKGRFYQFLNLTLV